MTTIKYNRFKDKYCVDGKEFSISFLYRNRFNKSILKDIKVYAQKTNRREITFDVKSNVVNDIAYILEPASKVLFNIVHESKRAFYELKRSKHLTNV